MIEKRKQYQIYFYVGWCSGPGNAKTLWGWIKEFTVGNYRLPKWWLSQYYEPAVTLKHWRWGMIKWGSALAPVKATDSLYFFRHQDKWYRDTYPPEHFRPFQDDNIDIYSGDE